LGIQTATSEDVVEAKTRAPVDEAAGLVASILGISTFAIRLTKNLYEFGSSVSAARSQIDRIAQNISNYALVLDLLAERLDDDGPIHSEKALKLVHDLRDQSNELLHDINDLLPRPLSGRRRVSLTSRLAWDFKVDLLVGELEYLKSTVNLVVQVLYAGKEIRVYR
jgi:hypothetical protein